MAVFPETFGMKGIKIAFIFTWGKIDPEAGYANPEDVDPVAQAAIDTGFRILDDTPTEESIMEDRIPKPFINNLRTIDFIMFSRTVAEDIHKLKDKLSCLLLYHVASQEGNSFMNHCGKTLPLLNSWEYFKGIKFPKIIIIQGNISRTAASPQFLLNEDAKGFDRPIILPKTANVLVMYLPKHCGAGVPVAEILKEELIKFHDINTNLTSVIRRIDAHPSTPLFSSTLHKQLFLSNGSNDGGELPIYNISKNKYVLVYTFLFGEFGNHQKSLMKSSLSDEKNLIGMCDHFGFKSTICIENGSMTADEFRSRINEIVEDKTAMKSCECIMIVISSHGDENGVIYASDLGTFSRQEVLHSLLKSEELKGKPKLLVIDACRGDFDEQSHHRYLSSTHQEECNWSVSEMPDVLQLLSSTESNVSYADSKSLFINALCNQLMMNGNQHDLMTVMSSVMEKVAHQSFGFQQPTFTSTLKKLLYFNKLHN